MKSTLLEQVSVFLLRKGYTVKSLTRTCFEVIARKGSYILLIKTLEDANAINKEFVQQMVNVSSYIKAAPLIVAEKAGRPLENNVVYSRFGVYTLNLPTFENSVDHKFPFVKSDHSGFTAHILGNKLKQLREQEGLSLGGLSKKIGVSKKMIQKYESGQSEITIQKATRIYDIFGHRVFDKIDIFSVTHDVVQGISSGFTKKYTQLGFEATETKKVPFDIIAKKDDELILTEIGDKANPGLYGLARLLEADNLVIFNKKKPKDIPSLTKKEFLEFEKANELIKFLKEF